MNRSAPERDKQVRLYSRDELKITSLLEGYRSISCLNVVKMGHGYAWLDAGTHVSLIVALNLVRTLTARQGTQIGSPNEVAFRKSWTIKKYPPRRAGTFGKNIFGSYLKTFEKFNFTRKKK